MRYMKHIAWFVLLFLLDQITKWIVLTNLKPISSVPLISGILELLYVENRGAAFGMLQNKQYVFLIIAIVMIGVAIWIMPRIPEEKHFFGLRLCVLLIASGAAGNMFDRVVRGYVVDFIYFKLIDFPVFNVADIYVTCAAGLLILLILFVYSDEDLERIFPKKGKA